MTHARQQIRDGVVSAVTGLTTTGARVFASRIYPLDKSELPGLCVFTINETSERASRDTLMRELSVIVEAYVRANDNYDDVIDSIAAEVEQAISNDATLLALVKDIVIVSATNDLMKDGDKPIAVVTLTFRCRYTTSPTNPQIIT